MAQVAVGKALATGAIKGAPETIKIIGGTVKNVFSGEPFFKSLWEGNKALWKNSANILGNVVGIGPVFKDPSQQSQALTKTDISDAIKEGMSAIHPEHAHKHGSELAFRDASDLNYKDLAGNATKKHGTVIVNKFERSFPTTGLDGVSLANVFHREVDQMVQRPAVRKRGTEVFKVPVVLKKKDVAEADKAVQDVTKPMASEKATKPMASEKATKPAKKRVKKSAKPKKEDFIIV